MSKKVSRSDDKLLSKKTIVILMIAMLSVAVLYANANSVLGYYTECFSVYEYKEGGKEFIMISHEDQCGVNEFKVIIYALNEDVVFEETVYDPRKGIEKLDEYAIVRVTFLLGGEEGNFHKNLLSEKREGI